MGDTVSPSFIYCKDGSNFICYYNILGDGVPSVQDLYLSVVPQYAVHWEALGIALGLEQHHLEIISQDNAHNPKRTEDCCKAMLLKWLKEIPSPTWDKLDDAINLIRSSSIRIVSDDFHYVRGELY